MAIFDRVDTQYLKKFSSQSFALNLKMDGWVQHTAHSWVQISFIERCEIAEVEKKKKEKQKILDARKAAFGDNHNNNGASKKVFFSVSSSFPV